MGRPSHATSSRNEQFTCRVLRDDEGQVTRIEVIITDGTGQLEQVTVNGDKAGLLAPTLHDIVRAAGVTGRKWAGSRSLDLDQGTGAQAWLLLTAAKPLRRLDRIDEVAEGVAAMSREEAAYWFSKAQRPRGLRAARLLLSDDTRRR